MRGGALLDVGLNALLGLALALAVVGWADHSRAPRLEVGRVHLTRLDEAAARQLAELSDRVEITYYVSARDRMPSHMRRVERDVTDLLEAMAEASGGRLHYQIVDPGDDPALVDFAARRRVTPVRVRSVSRDSWTEQEVWSTLTIAYGPRAPAILRGVGPEHLPRLQQLILAHLDELRNPSRPVYAFAAPAGHEKVRALLESRGRVIDVDPSSGAPLPDEADLLVWLAPGAVPPTALREIDRFLDRGRSMVVAGAEADARLVDAGGERALVLTPSGFDAHALWGHFGLEPADGLLLDERWRSLEDEYGQESDVAPVPYRITCIANNQDFQQMAYECNATLLFEAATALHLDGPALAERGWRADILGTSSERAWARPWDGRPIPLGDLPARTLGESRPKEPLMLWLRHVDPWRGQVVALAADTPFLDAHFEIPGTGHPRLLRVLLDTLASPDRLVQGRAEIHRAEPLPELDPGARAGWRAATVLALPLLLGALAWWRRRGDDVDRAPAGSGVRWGGLVLRGAVALVLLLAAGRFVGWRFDLSEDGHNLLHPDTVALARRAAELGDLRLELVFSGPERMPPDLRQPVRRLADVAADLAREVPGLRVERVRPEDLSETQREALQAGGVQPVTIASLAEESTTVRTLWSSVRISAGERQELLPFAELDAFEHAEFRLAFALWRLATGEHPVVAVAADNPRLSAAEAHEEFQRKGLIAPTGTDAYAVARQVLERVDFQVQRVDSREPVIEGPIDALVWFQPRRTAVPMLRELVGHLYRGGNALVAAQHFNIQARQYRGRGFDFVYWPQPQSPDIDQFYLPGLGLEMVREVLFDELNLPIDDQAQIAGASRRDFERMSSSLPFVIRAVGAHFAADSTITAGLGDQAFIWGSYLRLDPLRLAAAGLTAQTLISTSEHAWSFLWSGGWIPNELLEGPPLGDDGQPAWIGPLPLAVDVRGQFPWPEHSFDGRAEVEGDPPPPYDESEPTAEAAPGRLVLLGGSEQFKSQRLVELRPEFRGDHLLLNAVADLALGDGLPSIMARRPVPRGFGVLDESDRLRWRAVVLLAMPALLLGIAALRRLLAGAS